MARVSARDFNRDVSAAKREAMNGPVVITDRGSPAFVLLSIEDYRRLTGRDRGIDLVHRLSMNVDTAIEFESAEIELRVPEL